MSRRIDTGTTDAAFETGGERPLYLGSARRRGGDDYLGRLAKYIPAEIVGAYLTAAGMIPASAPAKSRVLWVIFAVCLLSVPLYFFFVTTGKKKKPLWPQIILGTIAFPVWVFAIGGPFAVYHWYEGNRYIASITLFFVTLAVGFVQPPPNS